MGTSATTFIEAPGISEISKTNGCSPTHRPSQKFYRPELDLLRFFAYASVFVHHGVFMIAPVFSNANGFGLSLFFLLSAFLITELLQREKDMTGKIAIREFYIRRCLRIWPLYFGFLALSVAVGIVFPGHLAPKGFLLAFILMVGNIYVGRYGFPNSPSSFLWSISVEEQFYLFWPMLNRHCSARALRVIAVLAVPVASVMTYFLARAGASELAIWSNTIVQFQMFAFGALLSLSLRGIAPSLGGAIRSILFFCGFGLWLAAARWSAIFPGAAHASRAPLAIVLGYFGAGAGCILIFLAVYGVPSHWIPKPLIYLGKISYGLYVFHEISLEIASWVLNRFPQTATSLHHTRFGIAHLTLGLLLSIAAAALSYRYFEKPFLRLKEKFAIVQSRTP
jgi:peptidoglycan/LPS O-acetylase OafA/YrhL